MCFDFVFSIKNMSASQHFMEKTSVRTVVGLMHNDCEENFKRDMPPTQAHRWNLMRRSSGGPDNDLFGAHLLHSKTDQTTYQEKA